MPEAQGGGNLTLNVGAVMIFSVTRAGSCQSGRVHLLFA